MMKAPSDQELLSGCIERKEGYWDLFVERFSKLIYWSIREIVHASACPNSEDFVRETFQDVFEKLLEKPRLEMLREVGNLKKFLSVMASHAALDRLKMLRRLDRRFSSLDGLVESQKEFASAETVVLDEPSRALLHEMLSTLSPKEGACIRMHYFDGKSHRQIGEILGFSADTVSTVIRRTRDKIRKALNEKGVDNV